jgi:hypothetical protein
MRPRYTAPTDRPRTTGDGPGRESRVTGHHSRARAERPRHLRALPWKTTTRSGLAAALVALALSFPVAAPAAGTSAAWPSKRDAHRVAVRVTAAACRGVAWCQGSDVVPAHRCRRAAHQTVYCAIAFITAQRQRCGGVVGVSRTRRGRLDQVMAVPQNCSADQPPGDDRPTPTID